MEILSFPSAVKFRDWLKSHHAKSPGIWLRIWKVSTEKPTVTYAEALDEALCFGWIDGQKKPLDRDSWLQRFTPRKSRSRWSKRNTEHVERLISERKMTRAGLEKVNAAKSDGRWTAAYDSFSNAKVPDDFLTALEKNKKARAFFKTLNKTNLYSISYRIQTAKKPETRARRIQDIIKLLARGKKLR